MKAYLVQLASEHNSDRWKRWPEEERVPPATPQKGQQLLLDQEESQCKEEQGAAVE